MDVSVPALESIEKIISIYNNSEEIPLNIFFKIVNELSGFYKLITKEDNEYFPTFYSKIFYINNLYNVSDDSKNRINDLFFKYKKLKHSDSSYFDPSFNDFAVKSTILLITDISRIEIQDSYLGFFNNLSDVQIYKKTTKPSDRIKILYAQIKTITKCESKNYKYEFICVNEEIGTFKAHIFGIWTNQTKIYQENITVNFLDVKVKIINKEFVIECDNDSTIILEPDYLVDVTEVASACHEGYYAVNFIKRFIDDKKASERLLFGSVVNYFFDELILNQAADFLQTFEAAIKTKPLPFLNLIDNKFNFKEFQQKLSNVFNNLKVVIAKLGEGDFSTEPSFLSPVYGIQGRLDLLMEFKENDNYVKVIELKSGKTPSKNITIDIKGNKFPAGVWQEHLFQIAGYNLLLKHVNEELNINSSILYISDYENPLRSVVCNKTILNNFIFYRNWITSLDVRLKNGVTKFFDNIYNIKSQNFPEYISKNINLFTEKYFGNSELIQAWFREFSSFIIREIFLGKVGADTEFEQNGFSALWKSSIEKKIADRTILPYLKINPLESDFKSMHLKFNIDNQITKSVFRTGDLVLLYPLGLENQDPTKNVILKGYIKNIDKSTVSLSLRNKKINVNNFFVYEFWMIESDYMEINYKKLFPSIFDFISIDDNKKLKLIGLEKPEFEDLSNESKFNLNEIQNIIFTKAINANDYFLIQGPPGTGKTSYMLASLVEYYFNHTEMNILLFSYTNRAVDEIYSSIKEYIGIENIIRIGSKTGNESDEILLSNLSEKMKTTELLGKIKSSRIIISTVASLNSNNEIFQLKKFDLAIVDEASQILEPQIIGILSKVGKFILIGDEKQLPAVILQDKSVTKVKNEILHEIELYDLGNSYFERLLRICKKNDWNDFYGSLEYQARMHEDIQEFPNIYFYGNILKIINERQKFPVTIFKSNSESKLERFLSQHRVTFIDCPIEHENKISKSENSLVKKIIEIISQNSEKLDYETVGIISPFRLQCNSILKELKSDYADKITVDTVERFQGSQRNIIIISMAVNSASLLDRAISVIDGTDIDRKLNVALTRAREHVIMLGSAEILNENSVYAKFINYCKSKNGFADLIEFIN
jgi:DNA replication ATP-dependent helicase Dna2